ncbi:glycosyltransferase family 4 protein [Pelagicoccus enzymogenes]|uniref:glycosyltransferase family 4 protein n=1 Tax=Pelagicoccus enzymogenes TaxID=2773457 RepID=UPI00280EC195|nr:glycosyltransferase family 4 protein [Pelagicoccus enzymogenes]MDQ8198911.1 glycosyltransferase family 4 protein [Pelagicoccus enzymogenes]
MVHDYAGHPFVVSLSQELASRGHEVTHSFASDLLTPRGVLKRSDGDPETLRFREIRMNPNYRRDKYKFVRRRRYECEYGRELEKAIAEIKPDVVLSGQTPSEPQLVAAKACRRMEIAFVTWVQDFYSIAVRKLASKKSSVLGFLAGSYYTRIDRRFFSYSDHIVSISDDFIPILKQYGVPESKVTTIENWGALAGIPLCDKDNPWSRRMGLSNSRVLMYSGTLAMKHNPEPLLDLAKQLEADVSAKIVVIAEGPGADYLSLEVSKRGIGNIIIMPFQPFEDLPNILGTANVFLAMLEPEAGIFSVPSKVLSYLCAGKPTVAAMPEENLSARILVKQGAGIVVPPGDSERFVSAAMELLKNDDRRISMGRKAREYAESRFEIGGVCDRFEAVFRIVSFERSSKGSTPQREAAVLK